MSDIAIKVEGLSKRYQIGKRERYKTFRETLSGAMAAPFRRLGRNNADIEEGGSFWALKDVGFDVNRGDVVGIIGRNGAGKSTLLKVLSRITEPTEGQIKVYGRVGSLLEVGTGFHPELTGRENVYLNGAILGMKRWEIAKKFDEIVAFSEIEKFLDTPVKHYSSGMYTRLAFAVAAHLEPEILIVDEVLAVGDAAFQKKCLGKMGDVAKQGRTVLFVSHNMAAVQVLCSSSIRLSAGQLVQIGDTASVISSHLAVADGSTQSLRDRKDRQGNQLVKITAINVIPDQGSAGDGIRVGDPATLTVQYENKSGRRFERIEATIGIYDAHGRAITFFQNEPLHTTLIAEMGDGEFRCRMDKLCLTPGNYYANMHIYQDGQLLDWIQQACAFSVHNGDFFGTGKLTYASLGESLSNIRGVRISHNFWNRITNES